jgi:hypothetical protein
MSSITLLSCRNGHGQLWTRTNKCYVSQVLRGSVAAAAGRRRGDAYEEAFIATYAHSTVQARLSSEFLEGIPGVGRIRIGVTFTVVNMAGPDVMLEPAFS